jgi:hypothetical protein
VVFARPLLASFGGSPETFIARGAGGTTVLLFGLVVVLVPWLVVSLPAAAFALIDGRVRLGVHLLFLVGLGTLAAVQMLRINTDLETTMVWGAAVVLAVALSAARWRFEAAKVFLRYAGLASVVFLLQFLAFSPSASLVWGGRSASIDAEGAAAVDGAVGEDGPPVVMIVLDALPTASLMDGEGTIDADVYPNLAALAGDGTWYRNHTTVAQNTIQAVPAALSAEMPERQGTPPVASRYPQNLFTMLGGTYEMQVAEQVTALCPASQCPDAENGSVRPLLRDARSLWNDSLAGRSDNVGLPGAFGSRHDDFRHWIEGRDLSPGSQPSLYFYHLLMPHDPWNWLPGGVRYRATMPANGQVAGRWGAAGTDVGFQRHALQTQRVDEMLGRFFDRLRDAGLYDDALIVVTADHGYAFEPRAPVRALAESQFDQIMWTPLIVKGPGQSDGVIDDSNVLSVDVLPIIADRLGLDLDEDLGWETDGVVPGSGEREMADKPVLDWEWSDLRPPDGEQHVTVDGTEGFERVLGADMIEGDGPLAVWQRTEHGGLVGQDVVDLDHGEPLEATLDVDGLGAFEDIDLSAPLPLELNGLSWISGEDPVALAVEGTVAAVVQPVPTDYGVLTVRSLLWPGAFVDGPNEITAYGVRGSVDEPTLHELSVQPR